MSQQLSNSTHRVYVTGGPVRHIMIVRHERPSPDDRITARALPAAEPDIEHAVIGIQGLPPPPARHRRRALVANIAAWIGSAMALLIDHVSSAVRALARWAL